MDFKFHEGDEVVALVTDESGIWAGQKYVVEFVYDPEDAKELGLKEPLYSLSHINGNSGMEGLESQLKLVRSWQVLAARKIPTKEQILKSCPLGWGYSEGFELDESQLDLKHGQVELFGRTEEGLPFGFRIQVLDVWQTD